ARDTVQAAAIPRAIGVRHAGFRPASGPTTKLATRFAPMYTDSIEAAAAEVYPSPSVRSGNAHSSETTSAGCRVAKWVQNPSRTSLRPHTARTSARPVGGGGGVSPRCAAGSAPRRTAGRSNSSAYARETAPLVRNVVVQPQFWRANTSGTVAARLPSIPARPVSVVR